MNGDKEGQGSDEAVDKYIQLCNKYAVEIDAAVVITLRTGTPVLKPSKVYTERDLIPLGELLLQTKPSIKEGLKSIKTIDFTHCTIGSNGAVWLNKVLQDNTFVRSLILTGSRIGPRGAESLANMLSHNKTLTDLNLHGNKLYLKGGLRIAAALKHNTSLKVLDLSNNHIGFQGVTNLQRELNKHISIQSFNLDQNFVLEEVLNSITHGIGLLFSLIGSIIMMAEVREQSIYHSISCGVFCFSLVLLYASSTLYHGMFKLRRTKDILQMLDHASIYILIAGTYSPFLVVNMHHDSGFIFLVLIWILGISGVVLETLFLNRIPSWLSLSLYVFMGWVVVFALGPTVRNVPLGGIYYLVAGGLFYTGGVYFFVTGNKKPINHAIWHVFVFFGSLCHYFAILFHVAPIQVAQQAIIPSL